MTTRERRLLDNLTAMATPIDVVDLERRGVLKPSREGLRWFCVMKPQELPPHASQHVTDFGQSRVGGRLVLMLRFKKGTTKKAAALLAQVERGLASRADRTDDVPVDRR